MLFDVKGEFYKGERIYAVSFLLTFSYKNRHGNKNFIIVYKKNRML